jgi:hypothetical protein
MKLKPEELEDDGYVLLDEKYQPVNIFISVKKLYCI